MEHIKFTEKDILFAGAIKTHKIGDIFSFNGHEVKVVAKYVAHNGQGRIVTEEKTTGKIRFLRDDYKPKVTLHKWEEWKTMSGWVNCLRCRDSNGFVAYDIYPTITGELVGAMVFSKSKKLATCADIADAKKFVEHHWRKNKYE
jgi:hypothetical protein